ncbi:MAG: hypothetical protein HQL69_13920 [Magnetococcales bacterium]|nr:hypothetical protein [Magnetococcales bacterium]
MALTGEDLENISKLIDNKLEQIDDKLGKLEPLNKLPDSVEQLSTRVEKVHRKQNAIEEFQLQVESQRNSDLAEIRKSVNDLWEKDRSLNTILSANLSRSSFNPGLEENAAPGNGLVEPKNRYKRVRTHNRA